MIKILTASSSNLVTTEFQVQDIQPEMVKSTTEMCDSNSKTISMARSIVHSSTKAQQMR